MKIDWTKPIQTKDGRKLRVLCTDANHPTHPIVCLISDVYGDSVTQYTCDGKAKIGGENSIDAINIPEKRELNVWVNVYENGCDVCKSKDAADVYRIGYCLACIHIKQTYTVGEGL